MNRGQLIEAVASKTELPIAQVDFVLTHVLEAIQDSLNEGEQVNIRRFGKFEPRHRNPVVRKNPRTGEEIPVPAKRSVGFIPSVNLKAALNETKGKKKRGKVRS